MFTFYHNPRCRKSRAGLEYLKGKTGDIDVRDYFKKPFTREEFNETLMKLKKDPSEIVRTQEEEYKKKLKGKKFTKEEWIHILLENPKLIQRPIVVRDYRAVIGDPATEIEKLF